MKNEQIKKQGKKTKAAQGEFLKLRETKQDITERKQVEVKLKQAAEEWLTTFNSIVDMVSIHDKDFKLVKVNKAFADTFKVKPEEVIGKKCYELVHGTKEPPTFCPHKQTIDTKKPHRAEFFEPRLGVYLEVSASPIFNENGEFIGYVHISKDITERKRADKALHLKRNKLTAILDSMVDGVYIVDQKENVQYVNPALKKEFGKPEGRKCYEYFHDRKEVCPWCKNKDVFAGKTVRWEWYSFKNQKTYDLIDTPLRNSDGSISKLEIFRDITGQKKTENSLKESEEKYRLITEASQHGIFRFDMNGILTFANMAASEITGYDMEEVEKGTLSLEKFYTGDAIHGIIKDLEILRSGKPVKNENILTRSDGTKINVAYSCAPILKKGECVGFTGTLEDITERKKAEEEVKQHQLELAHISRLSTIGQMASELAHELNQPLCATLSHLEGCLGMVKSGSSDTDKILKKLETAIKQIDQAGAIVSRVKGFAMKGKIKRSTAFINDIVLEALRFSETELRLNHITTELNLGEKIQPVLANSIQIEQVILNLIQNATEAMKNIPKPHRKLTISTTMLDNAIEVAVKDRGKGIDKDKGQNIFESFVTTKSEGLGIGLSISQSIIESHGGRIYFKDNSEHGVTFCFTLPLTTEKV